MSVRADRRESPTIVGNLRASIWFGRRRRGCGHASARNRRDGAGNVPPQLTSSTTSRDAICSSSPEATPTSALSQSGRRRLTCSRRVRLPRERHTITAGIGSTSKVAPSRSVPSPAAHQILRPLWRPLRGNGRKIRCGWVRRGLRRGRGPRLPGRDRCRCGVRRGSSPAFRRRRSPWRATPSRAPGPTGP